MATIVISNQNQIVELKEEKTKLDMEEYLIDMDFRLAMIEIGGEENDL